MEYFWSNEFLHFMLGISVGVNLMRVIYKIIDKEDEEI